MECPELDFKGERRCDQRHGNEATASRTNPDAAASDRHSYSRRYTHSIGDWTANLGQRTAGKPKHAGNTTATGQNVKIKNMTATKLKKGTPVAVALSGGVDSALAGHLLKQQGAAIFAVFMKNWQDDDTEAGCHDKDDLLAAAAAADVLGAELHIANFAAEYKERVFAPFLQALREGKTPNPDVHCNCEIKFAAFANHARQLGAENIATGHYARLRTMEGQWQLLKGEDSAKDQSYFLHRLNARQLAGAIFPLGGMHKADVREKARAAGLGNWSRKDSAGICFVGQRKFDSFLQRYIPPTPGEIHSPEGKVIGEHCGVPFYTIGQRRGLDIGGLGEAWFVARKNIKDNIIIAVQGQDHPLLYFTKVRMINTHWISGVSPTPGRVYEARLRHRHSPASCALSEVSEVSDTGGTAQIIFAQPQRAAAPGQYAVIYDGNTCLGGGEIEQAE